MASLALLLDHRSGSMTIREPSKFAMTVEVKSDMAFVDRPVVWCVLCLVLVFVSAYGGIWLTLEPGRIASIWIANAVLLRFVVPSAGTQRLGLFAAAWVANVAANVATGDGWFLAAGLAFCNSAEVAIASYFLLPHSKKPNLADRNVFGAFVTGAVIAGPLVSAILAAAVLGILAGADPLNVLIAWFPTDALGMLAAFPLLLSIQRRERRSVAQELPMPASIGIILLSIAVFATVFFQSTFPFTYMVFLPLILCAFYLGPSASVIATAGLAVIAIGATVSGSGPFMLLDGTPKARILLLQSFLAVAVLLVLTVNWLLEQRDQLKSELGDVVETALDAFVQVGESGNILNWNSQAEKLFGWRFEEALGRNLVELIIADVDRHELKAALDRFPRSGQGQILGNRREIRALRQDGREFMAELSVTALRRRDTLLFNGFFRDLTDKIAAEDRIRQSEKMEALGQLTGGIAHDFNNILTVITGTIEILAEAVAKDPQLAAITRMIDEAASRGAELTQHLLAFARKQPLQPRETDVNTLIIDTAKLLRPTLGAQIEIESVFEDEECMATVDPSQLATAILNLALNSRDAMPNGGKLIFETGMAFFDESYAAMHGDVRPGRYALIAVSDTGTGIPAAILDKVFNPFFTSKGPGKGTGLGLSMVYGFVKQSAGHIMIYSEEGHGTTIKMYLPPGTGALSAAEGAITAAVERGHETILVVEDDKLVRDYVLTQLHSLGYVTLNAANAAEALAIVAAGNPFDLLFTDVIMPGSMNGRQLANELQKTRPGLKVLFTSGYTENAIIHHGRLDSGVLLLAKPYRKSDLAAMVRKALAG